MYFVYILHSDSIKNFIVDIRFNESIANRISFKMESKEKTIELIEAALESVRSLRTE